MILILVRFMQIGRARESWQIYHKALEVARFMDLPALACTSNLHEPHQNKNHSLNEHTISKCVDPRTCSVSVNAILLTLIIVIVMRCYNYANVFIHKNLSVLPFKMIESRYAIYRCAKL